MKDFGSLVIYFGAFTVSIVFVWLYQKKAKKNISRWKKSLLIIGIMLPIIIIQGFRYNVGTDYANYTQIFNYINSGNEFYIKNYLNEPIFLCMNIILGKIFGTPIALFVVDAIVMNVLFFLVADYYKNETNMPMVYIAYYLFCFSVFLNIERQGMACLLIWYSLRYIEQKKLGKFLIIILVATGLHNTAIIFALLSLIMLFDSKRVGNITKKIVLCGLVISPVFYKNIVSFVKQNFHIFSEYSVYFKQEEAVTPFKMIIYMAMFYVPVILFYKSIKKSGRENNVLWVCTIVHILLYLLSGYILEGSRLVYYVFIGIIFFMGKLCKELKYQFNRKFIQLYFITTLILYYIRIYYIFGNTEVFPYVFIKL